METTQTRRVSSTLASVTAGHRGRMAVVATLSLLGGVAEAVFLLMVARAAFTIIDGGDRVALVGDADTSVTGAALLGAALVVFRLAMALVSAWLSADITARVVADLRGAVVQGYLATSWSIQQDENAGSLQELMLGFPAQAATMVTGALNVIVAAGNLVALVVVAIAVDPLGALAVMVSLVVLAFMLRPLRSRVERRAVELNDTNLELAARVNEASTLGMEVHVFDVGPAAGAHVREAVDRVRERARRLQFLLGSVNTVYATVAYLLVIVVLLALATADASRVQTLGPVVLVLLRSLSYGQSVQSGFVALSANAPGVELIATRLARFAAATRPAGGAPVASVRSLTARNVEFAYPDGHHALHEVDFEIGHPEIVGIVGPSGSGKSTLVQLLLGLRDPTAGELLADGRPIGAFDAGQWARRVTFVPQEPHLVAGSVADNVRFLRDDVTAADIEAATRQAHLHDEIVARPGGYGRDVGERGGHLSGGQRQRICIARALVERPDVLVLDEPTSALDPRSEQLIRDTLLELGQRMTVIIIAHRLSTLDICDRLLVMREGRVVGFDTPAALERTNAFFRDAILLRGDEPAHP